MAYEPTKLEPVPLQLTACPATKHVSQLDSLDGRADEGGAMLVNGAEL
jgi:hypothetical protein